MTKFQLYSKFKPSPEQTNAIEEISHRLSLGIKYQVLLGVTGSGKTFTMANIIEKVQKPTLIISHNKTLAAQLYQELRDFFPNNAVSFFVSYYDYYQPEAYIPSTDTYIEKDADINETIDKLRLAATTNLLTRNDSIVVASVSSIYNIGSPKVYGHYIFEIAKGIKITREQVMARLLDLQYERNDYDFKRGSFRVRGNQIDIYPAYTDYAVRLEVNDTKIADIEFIDPLEGNKFNPNTNTYIDNSNFVLYPAKHFMTNPITYDRAFSEIKNDLNSRVKELNAQGKKLEAYRLSQKVNYDIEMIKELGYVKGIENYSRYFDGRKSGDAPFSLLDYFNDPHKNDWLLFVDESHMAFPQIRGMYNGDLARKKTLIDYGFRLPSALDNRPLTFEEFMRRVPNFIAMSATPADWEKSMANGNQSEILVRPTGIPDPSVEIRPISNQINDVVEEIKKTIQKKQRVLVTTLTKRTAEDLSNFLIEKGFRAHYLHSDVATLERSDILDSLREGEFDVLIGINLLREGLDIPEVSLVAILDADKEGFLRSDVTLIQTMGRAARHVEGRVILYADNITGSIDRALAEVNRRRDYQIKYNEIHNIVPVSINKPIRGKLFDKENESSDILGLQSPSYFELTDTKVEALTPKDKQRVIKNLKKEMKNAASELDFELAARIRDRIREIS